MSEGEEPAINVENASGIWKNKEQVMKAIDALGPFYKKLYEEKWNTHLVTQAPCIVKTNMWFTADKEINRLADFKGLKIRTGSAPMITLLKGLGVSGQVVPGPETYMALKTGMIDGVASSATIVVANKWYEVLKYGALVTTAEAVSQDVRVNKQAWDELPDDLKDVVTYAFTVTYGQRCREMALNGVWDDHFVRVCEENGMKFTELPAEDLAEMLEVGLQVQLDYIEKSTPLTKEAWKIIEPIVLGK